MRDDRAGEVVASTGGHQADGLRRGFDAFWDAYPRKAGKAAAWKWWQKRKPDAGLLAAMVDAIDWQRRQDSWLRDGGRFVPHPSTWLHAERWLDEPSTTPRISDRTLGLARATEEFLKP